MIVINKIFKTKTKESFLSVFPIMIIGIILSLTLVKLDVANLFMFILGAIFLIIGMAFFSVGAEISLMKIGEETGKYVTRKRKIWLFIIFAFLLGFLVTIAEPDLTVLAEQSGINKYAIIISISIGIGVFLAISVLRIIFQLKISVILIISYGIVFLLGIFVPKDFLPMSFDASGVTTGAMTVPFIIAFGFGISSSRGDRTSTDDSFGLVGIASIGPIIAIMILGIFMQNTPNATINSLHSIDNLKQFFNVVNINIVKYLKEVLIALSPILLIYLIMNIFIFKQKKRNLISILFGFVITYIGLVLFLAGANMGFLTFGSNFGSQIAHTTYNWLLIPMGLLFGMVIVIAEPAVHVLNNQVDSITDGRITRRTMMVALAAGNGIAVSLAMVRVLTGISIWWIIIPGYILALSLTLIAPKIFTAIAFDSGGVASGPLTVAFLLPFAIGAAQGIEGANIFQDAFGLVALVSMMPLIIIQLVGLIYKIKIKAAILNDQKEEIIYFGKGVKNE